MYLLARARTIDDEIAGQVHERIHRVIESTLFVAFAAGVALSLEDRGSQITFSALGQQAPIKEKEKWEAILACLGRVRHTRLRENEAR